MHRRLSFSFTITWLLLTIFTFLNLAPEESQAVPAFARKYSMSCTTCHAPFPRLKDYGDEFAGNGFVLADKDAPRYTKKTGDERLSLIRQLPLAVRMEGFIKYQSETDKEVDLTTPYNLKLISGGSLTDGFAYYFYFFLSERGEVAGIEDAYVMFNNLFDSELDIYFGQFQVSDPLFKREVRLTYEDYLIYKHKTGESNINLAYDRGFMITYGFETGTDVIIEIINGNGIGEADEFRTFDSDKYKCFVGRISQDAGEYIRLGGFGYYGKEGDENPNEITYFGPDMTLTYGPVQANLQYMERRDSDPMFNGHTGDDFETRGAMCELLYIPDDEFSIWYVAAVYNWIESNLGDYKYNAITGHLGYVWRTNIRFFVEFTRDLENEESRVVTGFVTGF